MKIKILKSFPTTHYGYLHKDAEIPVADHFGDYCINRLKAAVQIQDAVKTKKAKSKK